MNRHGTAAAPRERVALVGLAPDSLDLIHLVRERGSEVCLVADADPASRTHALAAVFRVPSTGDLARVEESGCDLLVLPDPQFGADSWQPRWTGAGLRCMTVAQAWRHFTDAPAAEQPPQPGPRPDPAPAEPTTPFQPHPAPRHARPTGEPPPMSNAILEQEVESEPYADGGFFPAAMRATATHLEEFLDHQRAATDAAAGVSYLWDEVLGELVPSREILNAAPLPGPGAWAQRWIRRAWSERRALVFQEADLLPEGGAPQRSRAMLALPLGEEGILYLEDAWLPVDPHSPARQELPRAAREWAEAVAASRVEQSRVLRQRLVDRTGQAVFEILPEDDTTDPWPPTAARLVELLEADAVVFHFADGGTVVSAPGLEAPLSTRIGGFLGARPAEALRAMPQLAARARTAEGQALRALGIGSFLGWAQGDGPHRVAIAAVRLAASNHDEFQPEHLVALKKFLGLARALSRPL